MKFVEQIYGLLVNRVPEISMQYQAYRKKVHGVKRSLAWIYLMKLNMEYSMGKRRWNTDSLLYTKKILDMPTSESSLSKREDPKELARQLSKYDVISFDVFDTLILRPFSKPTDLFFYAGAELGYLDFERIRIEIEQLSRKKKIKKSGTKEVTFEEIWHEMEQETGIPMEKGMSVEWECEQKYCFANPYMLEVVRELERLNRTFIVISDMYFGESYIRKLLNQNGINNFTDCFVSCDHGKSKGEGSLYDLVKKRFGEEKKYVHIGDNEYSDFRQARNKGITSIIYHNVNDAGMKYRVEDMSVITGSVYRGLINSYLHNGLKEYSMEYEYGFVYGGLFVMGYCRWIHEFAENNSVDKILFLARDGDILEKVYHILFPKRDSEKKTEYVYWSRLAATKMAAGYFKYDYFRRFLYHKVNQGYTMENIFHSMELDDMLEDFLENSTEKRYSKKSELDEKTADEIKAYLKRNWETVLGHYKEQLDAGRKYYQEVLSGCQRAVAVDVGWAGSGAVTLNYVVNEIWGLECEVIGLVAGTNSVYNQEPDTSESLLQSGALHSYMYSQKHNRDLWKMHNPNQGDNIIVELLLASEKQSFRRFSSEQSGFVFCDKKNEINASEVQRGIIDFVNYYLERMQDIPKISGRDAYAPITVLLENRNWVKKIISDEEVTMNLE